MTDMNVVIDCSAEGGDGITVRPLSDAEVANLARIVEETAAARTTRDAGAAARDAAVAQLKTKAKTDANLAVVARALGIDPNAPDPAKPAG